LEGRDEMSEITIQKTLIEAGVLTVDEVRAMRGLPPLAKPDAATRNEVQQ
jgi:hypothetical protein